MLLVKSPEAAMTMVYLRGGRLVEVSGRVAGPVLEFTAAYLKASIS